MRNSCRGPSSPGPLLATCKCGLLDAKHRPRNNFPVAAVFGVDFVSEERKYAYDEHGKPKSGVISTYLESSGHPLAKMLAVSTVGLPGSFLKVKRTRAEEVMRYRLPFMVEDIALNTVELAADGEAGLASGVTIRIDPGKLKVVSAR